MAAQIDLHIHTTASDGSASPAEAVSLAASLGLSAIAITDHDTVSGIPEAVSAGRQSSVDVIPGLEISADYRNTRVHILGLFVEPDSPALSSFLNWAAGARQRRNQAMLAAMQAAGLNISQDELHQQNPSVSGRPHMAALLAEKGYATSVQDAFDRYLNRGRPFYRALERLPLAEAAAVIRSAGGLPIVAHPFQYGFDEPELLSFLAAALDAGCAGLEAYYSEHSPEEQSYLLELAAKWGLAVSGGSDWHGTRKPHIRMGSGINGQLSVPRCVLDDLTSFL